jgi:hypothetical protein
MLRNQQRLSQAEWSRGPEWFEWQGGDSLFPRPLFQGYLILSDRLTQVSS